MRRTVTTSRRRAAATTTRAGTAVVVPRLLRLEQGRPGPDASEVIQLAANGYRAGAPVTAQVTGYTDTSGSYRYNERLSVRRAGAVAATLAQDSVPPGAMVVTGRGENDLRVPTPDGVREPQTRRVEIVEGVHHRCRCGSWAETNKGAGGALIRFQGNSSGPPTYLDCLVS